MRISDWSSDVCSSDLIGEAAGDAVYAGMLGAVTEFAAAIDQVFQHDEALARAIVVPVRVIAGRGLRGQLVREKVIEAGFERMDVDIVELATPVGLDAEVPGQIGRAASRERGCQEV